VAESSIASGVRRIEALTGAAALAHVQQAVDFLKQAARLIKTAPEAVCQRIEKMLAQQKGLEKEVVRLKAQIAAVEADQTEKDIRSLNGLKVVVKKVAVDSPAALRDLADRFKDKIRSGIVVLGGAAEAKAMLIAVVTKDLTDRYHAGQIVKQIAAEVGGSGGGRPDMAQAGGNKPENLDQALEKAYAVLQEMAG
jgi:alanyl-tRNA synthetase